MVRRGTGGTLAGCPIVMSAPFLTGLYDLQGVLRYSGRDSADCLAYADFFALKPGSFTLASLELYSPTPDSGSEEVPLSGESSSLLPAPAVITPVDVPMAA